MRMACLESKVSSFSNAWATSSPADEVKNNLPEMFSKTGEVARELPRIEGASGEGVGAEGVSHLSSCLPVPLFLSLQQRTNPPLPRSFDPQTLFFSVSLDLLRGYANSWREGQYEEAAVK